MATNTILPDSDSTAEHLKTRLEIAELRSKLGWDRWVGRGLTVTSSLILVAGFLVGLSQFRESKEQEYRTRFWEKRMEVYSAITNAAARTAVTRDSAERVRAFREFEQIYHGVFVLIADDSAGLAAKNFYGTYLDYTQDPAMESDLPIAARSLSLAARGALARASEGVLDPTPLTLH